MSKHSDLAKNTLILAIGKSAGALVSFLLLPVYTILLSPNDYGLVDLIITYIALFVPLLTLQMEMALFRFLVDVRGDEEGKRRVVSNALQIALITIILLIGLYVVVANLLHISYIWLIALNVGATIFSNLFMQISRGFGENKRFAIANIIAGVTLLLMSGVLVVGFRMGIAGVLLASAVAGITAGMYLFASLKMHKYISLTENDKAMKKQLLGYALPLIPNGMSWWVINVSDRTIVTIFLGLTANGIYAVSNKFAAIFISIFGIFGMSWTESASVHINAKNRDVFFSEVANMVVRGFGSLGLLMLAVLPILFPIIIGLQFRDAINYIPALILAALFSAIVGIYSAIYLAKKMTKVVMRMSISSAIINIGLNLLFINLIGIYAAALSTAVAYLVMAVYRHYDLKKFIKITYEKGLFLKLFIAYSVVIVLYYCNNPVLNVVNLLLMLGITMLLNRSIIGVAFGMVRNTLAARQ